MSVLKEIKSVSWSAAVFVVVATVSIWGLYLWRHAADRPVLVDPQPVAQDADQPYVPPGDPAADRLVTLRASRPAGQLDLAGDAGPPASESRDAAAAASVMANAPPSMDVVAEMELTTPAATPAPPPPVAADPSRGGPAVPSPASAVEPSRNIAAEAMRRGDLIDARRQLSASLAAPQSADDRRATRMELARLADALLLSRAAGTNDPLAATHVIETGDTLYEIARAHAITFELLARINEISEPNRLMAGQRIKVLHGPFHAVISKSEHRMDVFLADVLVRSYPVGLGTNGGTPPGTWRVRGKLENPDWTDPQTHQYYAAEDPNNPVGERWLGLEGVSGEAVGRTGFGIHGTIDDGSIGRDQSMGCIRLSAEDVAEVYELLTEGHSTVLIKP
jgi:lipoprotein-anchoring transpeptidase ErfK/SrfK